LFYSHSQDYFLDKFSVLYGSDAGGNTSNTSNNNSTTRPANSNGHPIRPSFAASPALPPGSVSARLAALEVEERVWSMMYGLKGDVDVTVDAELAKYMQKKELGTIRCTFHFSFSLSFVASFIVHSLSFVRCTFHCSFSLFRSFRL
jgi:hypothetical protein